MMGRPQNTGAMFERMKPRTKLERKGKDPIYPHKVERREDAEDPAIVCYFSGDSQPIEATDKDVTFTSQLGPFEIRAKFSLKEMVYQGNLEL